MGIDHEFKENHKIDILPFYYTARLSDLDITYLNGISTYGASETRKQRRYGLNMEYLLRELTLFGQLMWATDGHMDRNGWYIQPSYVVKLKDRKTLTQVEFLLRIEAYKVDLDRDPTDSRTWNRDTFTLAAIADVVKNLKVKTEVLFNDEHTGGGSVRNNEVVVQLEAKF